MTVHQLHEMLGGLDDTQEIVLEAPHADDGDHDDPLVLAWRSAARNASRALRAWRSGGGGDSYARYRALADQADAAQDALEATAARRPRTA
jgi:hypothetical protein